MTFEPPFEASLGVVGAFGGTFKSTFGVVGARSAPGGLDVGVSEFGMPDAGPKEGGPGGFFVLTEGARTRSVFRLTKASRRGRREPSRQFFGSGVTFWGLRVFFPEGTQPGSGASEQSAEAFGRPRKAARRRRHGAPPHLQGHGFDGHSNFPLS
jgi:hypothetical protein